jgi:putative ABC transport system substrate-binding protein
VTTPVTDALVRTTQTIPIVIATVADPISSGFVTSLGRPGGNVTGFALYEAGMSGKWLELLKQIAPGDASGAAVQSGNDCAGQILHVLH